VITYNFRTLPNIKFIITNNPLFQDLYITEKVIPELDKYAPKFERLIQETGSGFFGKTGPTYVDFYIAECIYTLSTYKPKTFQTYFYALYQHMRRVHALPALQEHFKYYKYTHPKV
jgi:glutathione S-transferase